MAKSIEVLCLNSCELVTLLMAIMLVGPTTFIYMFSLKNKHIVQFSKNLLNVNPIARLQKVA